jgi:hypothetical protein
MAAVAEHDVDLDALERDARVHIEELRAQRAHLSAEVLSDPTLASELADVEARLASVEGELGRLELAREELGRRDVVAREQAERDRVAAALAEAERLGGVRAEHGRRVDDAARLLGEEIVSYLEVADEQNAARRSGGLRSGQDARPGVERAFGYWMRRTGGERAFGQLAAVGSSTRPLAEGLAPARPAKQ